MQAAYSLGAPKFDFTLDEPGDPSDEQLPSLAETPSWAWPADDDDLDAPIDTSLASPMDTSLGAPDDVDLEVRGPAAAPPRPPTPAPATVDVLAGALHAAAAEVEASTVEAVDRLRSEVSGLVRRFESLQTQVGDVQATVDNLPPAPPLALPAEPLAAPPAPAPVPGVSPADLQAVRAAVREDVRVAVEQLDDLLRRGLGTLRTELQRSSTAPGGERLVDVVGLVASKLSTSLDGVVASLAQSRELTARSEELVHRLADDFVKAKSELTEAVDEIRRLPTSPPPPAPVIAEEVAGTVARALRSELSVALAELKSELRIELRTVLRQLGDEQGELSQQVAASQAQLRRLTEDLAELAEIRADQQRQEEQTLRAELAEVAAEVAVIRRRLPANLRQVAALDDGQVLAMIEAIVTALEPVITAAPPRRRRPVAPARPAVEPLDEEEEAGA
ncbi:MAG: hypothetical protein JO367_20440 [Actinobacteria bacterium]|nr:hypothetical protein [Actinomycetota bacterium]